MSKQEFKTLGEYIAHLRKEKGISQRELGVVINKDYKKIADYEHNRRPITCENLLILEGYLGIPKKQRYSSIFFDTATIEDARESLKEISELEKKAQSLYEKLTTTVKALESKHGKAPLEISRLLSTTKKSKTVSNHAPIKGLLTQIYKLADELMYFKTSPKHERARLRSKMNKEDAGYILSFMETLFRNEEDFQNFLKFTTYRFGGERN